MILHEPLRIEAEFEKPLPGPPIAVGRRFGRRFVFLLLNYSYQPSLITCLMVMSKDTLNSKIYKVDLGNFPTVVSISGFVGVLSFAYWSDSGSWLSLSLLVICAILFLASGKPVLDNPRIILNNGQITQFRRFRKPLVFQVDTLYRAVERMNGDISFQFKVGPVLQVQITPKSGYDDGEELQQRIFS